MTALLCNKCGKKDAFVTTKGKLEKLTSAPIGAFGAIPPVMIGGAIGVLRDLIAAIVDWLRDKNTKYVVCGACGHYEKL